MFQSQVLKSCRVKTPGRKGGRGAVSQRKKMRKSWSDRKRARDSRREKGGIEGDRKEREREKRKKRKDDTACVWGGKSEKDAEEAAEEGNESGPKWK